ncbi:MAG: sigma-70 family RNA polymerase sigma factor [Myxococcota bacterium]
MSEPQLLAAWGEGQGPAGEELFRRHYDGIARFFRNKAPPDAQEDLIQNTFLACVESRAKFRGDGSLRSFLFSIAHHVLCRHYRKRRGVQVPLDTGKVSAQDLSPGVSTLWAKHARHRQLLDALQRIPLDYQVVLELYYWESMPAGQVAESLGIPLGTARTRIRRGRQLVEEQLALTETPDAKEPIDLDRRAAEVRRQLTQEV